MRLRLRQHPSILRWAPAAKPRAARALGTNQDGAESAGEAMATRSAEEDELWRQEVAAWDCLKAGDFRGYLALLHKDITAWPRHAAAPLGKDAIFQHMLPRVSLYQSPVFTVELTPLTVRVLGDVGIVQYRAHIRVAARPGVDETIRFSRTWLRTGNGWRLIAGMNAPVAGS